MSYRVVDISLFQALFVLASIDQKIPVTFTVSRTRYFYELHSGTTDKTLYVRAVIYGPVEADASTRMGSQNQYSQLEQSTERCGLFVPISEAEDAPEPQDARIEFSVLTSATLTVIKRLTQLYSVAGGLSSRPNNIVVSFPTKNTGKALKLFLSNPSVRLNGRSSREFTWSNGDGDSRESADFTADEQSGREGDVTAVAAAYAATDFVLDSADNTEVLAVLDTTYLVPLCSDEALISASTAAAGFLLTGDKERILASVRVSFFYGMCNQMLCSLGPTSDSTLFLEFIHESVMDVSSYRIRLSASTVLSRTKIITELPSNLTSNNAGNIWLHWTPRSVWCPCVVQLGRVQLGLLNKLLKIYMGLSGLTAQVTLIVTKNFELVLRFPLMSPSGEKIAMFTYFFLCVGHDT